METYGKFRPIINNQYYDDEEMLQQREEMFPQQTCRQQQVPLNRRKLFKPRRYLDEEVTSSSSSSESSSSSSSSESSDSEIEELNTHMKRTTLGLSKNLLREKLQQQQRFFVEVVDLHGLRPQDVKVLLNPVKHVLLVKAKRITMGQQLGGFQGEQGKLVRVIPLPRNICLQKLVVKATLRGELIVKVPYLTHSQLQSQCPLFQQQQRRGLPTWAPIHVTYKGKGNNVFGSQLEKQFFNFISIPVRHTFERCRQQGQQQNLRPHTFNTPQFIRDEVTGKLAILLNVNTVGFRPEEIRVRLNSTKNVLIVEAGQRGESELMQFPWETTTKKLQKFNIDVKYLRREFLLPFTMDVNKIAYQVQRNGVLSIKLPVMQKKHFNTMQSLSL